MQSGGELPTFRRNPQHIHRTTTRHIPNDPLDTPQWQPQFLVMKSSDLQGNLKLETVYCPETSVPSINLQGAIT